MRIKLLTKITLLSTSDTHGYIYPTNYTSRDNESNYGLARAATIIQQECENAQGPVIVIENGDFLQGSPLAYYAAKKEPSTAAYANCYNQLPYSVGIIGNHEFNYGIDQLRASISASSRPFLCANIVDDAGEPALGQPYTVIEQAGIKLAILGLTTSYIPHWETPDHIQGLHFNSAVETAKKWLPHLHELADVVCVAYHGGFERDLTTNEPTEALTGENEGSALLALPGIDALITGHQHREIAQVVDGVPTTQPGAKGAYVGKIVLDINDHHVTAATSELLSTGQAQPQPKVLAAAQELNEKTENWLDVTIGQTEGDMKIIDPMQVRLHSHPYIQFIQDVQRWATGAPISGTALFNNEGQGFTHNITFRSVLTNYIYPNTLAVERISGADLKRALERTASFFVVDEAGKVGVNPVFAEPKPQFYNYDLYAGIEYDLDLSQPIGERITRLEYQQRPIRATDSLEVVLNQYRAVGGGNYTMFSADKIVKEVQLDMTELIADYLAQHPTVKAYTDANMTIKGYREA